MVTFPQADKSSPGLSCQSAPIRAGTQAPGGAQGRPALLEFGNGGVVVNDSVDALVLDLLEWLDPSPRPYAEVMDAWRTSCPRLPVWEEANDRGFVERQRVAESGGFVAISSKGRAHLRQHRSSLVAPGLQGRES